MEDFDLFWKAYPRKLAKGAARKAWEKTAKIRPSIDALLKAVVVARASDQWRKDGGSFIPYPATWLNQERWDDEHEIEMDAVKDEKAWHESVSGIQKMGESFGLVWDDRNETFQDYTKRVRHALSEKVTPIRREVA